MSNEVNKRIDIKSNEIKNRLSNAVDDKGKIDKDKLDKLDVDLARVLNEFALAKTWRDDPEQTAKDVAKLLEARSNTPLGTALEELGKSLKK